MLQFCVLMFLNPSPKRTKSTLVAVCGAMVRNALGFVLGDWPGTGCPPVFQRGHISFGFWWDGDFSSRHLGSRVVLSVFRVHYNVLLGAQC